MNTTVPQFFDVQLSKTLRKSVNSTEVTVWLVMGGILSWEIPRQSPTLLILQRSYNRFQPFRHFPVAWLAEREAIARSLFGLAARAAVCFEVRDYEGFGHLLAEGFIRAL